MRYVPTRINGKKNSSRSVSFPRLPLVFTLPYPSPLPKRSHLARPYSSFHLLPLYDLLLRLFILLSFSFSFSSSSSSSTPPPPPPPLQTLALGSEEGRRFDYSSLDVCAGVKSVPILYRRYDELINQPAKKSIYHSVEDEAGVALDGFLISLLLEFLKTCPLNYTLFTKENVSWSNSNPNTSMVEIVSENNLHNV